MEFPISQDLVDRLERVWLVMGRALWQVQGVEQMMAKHYAIAFELEDPVSREQIQEKFERNFVHPAGRLLGRLKSATDLTSELESRLNAFVAERNWLAHKARRQNFEEIVKGPGFDDLLARLDALATESIELMKVFHELLLTHLDRQGRSRKMMEERLLAESQRILGG